MRKIPLIDLALWLLLAIGFVAAVAASYANLNNTTCLNIGTLPICYLVLAAYIAMIMAIVISHNGLKYYLFCLGWGVAFTIALLCLVAEFMFGVGCCSVIGINSLHMAALPRPTILLCVTFLALSIGILILFILGPYKRVCNRLNEPVTKYEQI